jgi:uncharacterized membrane protein
MGEIARQTKEELRHLPLVLGKLLGGIVAVIGFAGWVLRMTRHTGAALPWFLVGLAGIALFLLAARALARRGAGSAAAISSPPGNRRTSLVAWGLLLLFAVIFLVSSWFVTK